MAVRPGNREAKLRSVDGERTGRVIEPRKLCIVEADAVGLAEGSILEPRGGETATLGRIEALARGESRQRTATPLDKVVLRGQGERIPPGSESRACTQGSPRNLGDPDVSVAEAAVPSSDATSGAKRDGRRGVGAPRSTRKAGTVTPGDPAEGRRCRVTERFGGKMAERPSSGNISTKLERMAKLAKQMPGVALTTLAHHIDLEWLNEAYRRTRKDGAVGVDGQTAAEYAVNLQDNLKSLLDRAKSGDHYRAPPVRRVHIPKGDGHKTRPIGIPAFEDKVLQRAVAMVLEAVYEQDFLDCSYGFRPKRSAHQALRAVWKQAMDLGGCWVLEADIEDFFGTVDLTELRAMLRHRVQDGVLLRLLDKWLKAGVMEEGCVYHPETGVPQGGVVSPILSNVYLHEVLDQWFERQVKPRLRGRAHLVRSLTTS